MCDKREDVVAKFCKDNELDGVPRVSSVDELVARDDVDAVLVCTPDYAHREPAVTCFAAGRHCLVEKPVATKSDDAGAICESACDFHTR